MRRLLVIALATLPLSLPAQEKKGYTEAAAGKIAQEAQDALAAQDFAAAAAAFKKLVEVQPDNARAWHLLGYSLHAAGKLDEALQYHLKAAEFESTAPVATYNVACVYALKGDTEKAFQWLAKAVERGFNNPEQLDIDSDMDSLRKDPRFAQIRKKMVENAASGNSALQLFAPTTQRRSQRFLFWSGSASPGQVAIDYGTPPWKDSYEEQIDSERMIGRRWRLGKDFWTTLDTNLDLTVGGVKIPAGAYYLTAEHRADGKFVLAFNDPQEIRKKKLDAYFAHRTQGGIEVELEHSTGHEIAETLAIQLVPDKEHPTRGKLVIRFGPHSLTAPVQAELKTGYSYK